MKDESEAPVKKVAAKPAGPTLKSAAGPTLKKQAVEVEEEKIEEQVAIERPQTAQEIQKQPLPKSNIGTGGVQAKRPFTPGPGKVGAGGKPAA